MGDTLPLMDPLVKRRVARERLNLGERDIGAKQASVVVSPAISRRPEIDALLGDMAFIARHALQEMRNATTGAAKCNHCGRGGLKPKEMRENRWIFESVLKQARVEMDLEKHVQDQTAAMGERELASTIRQAIHENWTPQSTKEEVADIVLVALGLHHHNPESPYLPSESA